jgi:ketopantoate reductase
MRYIIYGASGVGGVIGARLFQADGEKPGRYTAAELEAMVGATAVRS